VQPHRTFTGVRFLPLNSIANPDVAVKIRENGAGNSLQTPFSRRGEMASGSFLRESLDFFFFLLFFFFSFSFLFFSILATRHEITTQRRCGLVAKGNSRFAETSGGQLRVAPTMHFVATTVASYFR
jgi:hypothetical protein